MLENKVKGRPEEQMISLLALRSMKHASYYPKLWGILGWLLNIIAILPVLFAAIRI
jgi:exoribonuclease R